MEIIVTIIGIIFIGLLIWLIIEVKKSQHKKPDNQDSDALTLLAQQMNNLRESMDDKLMNSNRDMSHAVKSQFSESQKLIQTINDQVSKQLINVTREISETKETNKQVFDLASQLADLEKVLKNQKTRGNLGEMGLELILSNILSPLNYKMQYFKYIGTRV